MGIHFLISQLVGTVGFSLLYAYTGRNVYSEFVILLTGVTGLLTMPFAWYFYRRDRLSREAGGLVKAASGNRTGVGLSAGEALLLLFMGAGFGIAGNMLMNLLQVFIRSTYYQDTMDQITEGKGLFVMILWMGIVAPIAEEMIFRWLIFLRLRDYMKLFPAAVISGVIFGIYHGNLLQGIYATGIGILLACFLEKTGNLWSCVLLHMGANIWATVLTELGAGVSADKSSRILINLMMLVCLGAAGIGSWYFRQKRNTGEKRTV